MTRTFLRVFYITFLWMLLLANMIFSFDMINNVTSSWVFINNEVPVNAYFGVSTLINGFKNLDNMPLGKFVFGMGSFFKRLQQLASNIVYADWPDFSKVSTFFEGLMAIFGVVKRMGEIIFGVSVWMFSMVVAGMYFICLILAFTFNICMFFGGEYYAVAPSHIWDSDSINVICNCITPLISAV